MASDKVTVRPEVVTDPTDADVAAIVPTEAVIVLTEATMEATTEVITVVTAAAYSPVTVAHHPEAIHAAAASAAHVEETPRQQSIQIQ